MEETGEQARLLRMRAIVPPHAILAETPLDSVPQILVYDGFVLAGELRAAPPIIRPTPVRSRQGGRSRVLAVLSSP